MCLTYLRLTLFRLIVWCDFSYECDLNVGDSLRYCVSGSGLGPEFGANLILCILGSCLGLEAGCLVDSQRINIRSCSGRWQPN